MTDVTAQPPVAPALVNADGTANIYVTTDPSVNRLTLTLTASANADVGLPAGTPAEYGELPAGQSAIYVFFDGLLANEEIRLIDFSATGWTPATYLDKSELRYLVIAPDAGATLAHGTTLSFSLTNVLVTEQPTSGTATIQLAGATGISPLDATLSLFVNLADPPHPNDQPLDVDIGFDVPDVYSGQSCELVLHLINRGGQPLVPGGYSSWGPSPPTFQLTLLYGDSLGDLTTIGEAGNIQQGTVDTYGNVWKPVTKSYQGQSPYWTMQPDPNGGGTVLGVDEEATVEFSFSGIEATVPAGLDYTISVAYVSWTGVPGYKDGAQGIPITKHAGPSVVSFTADPPVVPYGAANVQTTLAWTTAHAQNVTFDVPGVPPSEVFNTPGTGPIEGGITVAPGTTLGITAYEPVADGKISTSASFVMPQVTQTDVPVHVDGSPVLVLPPPGTTAYVFEGAGTRCNVIDLATPEVVNVFDLADLVQSTLLVNEVLGATYSPDGKLLYVAVQTGSESVTPWLLVLDPQAPSVVDQGSLGTPPANQAVFMISMAVSPDGGTLYASSWGMTSVGNSDNLQPYQLQVVDTAALTVTASYSWFGVKVAGPAVAAGEGGRLFVDTGGGPAVIDTAGGFEVAAFLDLYDTYKLYPVPLMTVSADQSTIHASAMDLTTYDQNADTVDLVLVTIDVDAATGALSLAAKLPLGLSVDFASVFGLGIPLQWMGGLEALSADGATLYFWVPPSSMGAVDLATGALQVWPCNAASFTPFAFATGAQAATVYMVQGNPIFSAIALAT